MGMSHTKLPVNATSRLDEIWAKLSVKSFTTVSQWVAGLHGFLWMKINQFLLLCNRCAGCNICEDLFVVNISMGYIRLKFSPSILSVELKLLFQLVHSEQSLRSTNQTHLVYCLGKLPVLVSFCFLSDTLSYKTTHHHHSIVLQRSTVIKLLKAKVSLTWKWIFRAVYKSDRHICQ